MTPNVNSTYGNSYVIVPQNKCKLLAVGSLFFWQWEHPPLAVGTYTASGNSLLAVGMPCAFYSQQSSPKLDAPSALNFFIIAVQTPGSGISILLAVGTPSTGSGNLYCQWELSPSSGNALCILFPTSYRKEMKAQRKKIGDGLYVRGKSDHSGKAHSGRSLRFKLRVVNGKCDQDSDSSDDKGNTYFGEALVVIRNDEMTKLVMDLAGSYHITHRRDFLYDFKVVDGGSI
nr:hypothetical protein [Tanacetum cinerariifolium]